MVGCCSFGVNGLAQWCCCCCPGGKKRARLKSLEKTSETAHFAFRKGRTFSEKTTEVEHSDGSVTVCRERVFKSRACLEDVDGAALVSQLQHIIDTLYWGKAASLEDCFDPKVADDGIVCVKIFHDILAPDAKFYYWSAHFGGNVTGYLLASTAGPLRRLLWNVGFATGEQMWALVLENVDGDWIWKDGRGEEPRGFLDRVKRLLEMVDGSNRGE
mmetsp:Transcript_5946/g.17555  ORF Transcript_5946/g.17555 Transcript_5946/m.17555 type:complete len:215 (-) Transcript_5946:42-686(-)